MSKKPAIERVTQTFDLRDLPTAQHRAGLAGLILQIDSMGPDGNRRPENTIPVIESITRTSATVVFTKDSTQGVFDDLYEAKYAEVVVANKWPGKVEPKPGEFFVERKDPKTGESKRTQGFAYDVVVPQAPCLSRHLQENAEPWLELWRRMVWEILRGGNNVRSRAPFAARAENKPTGEGATAWAQLIDLESNRTLSRFPTASISGALMLGAQAVNAEAVPFTGRVDHNLLLHFWQVAVITFVPQVVNKKDAKVERVGYVLAIPDVSDLIEFRVQFPEILGKLKAEKTGRTPPAAKIDLPDQACLEVIRMARGTPGREKPSDGTEAIKGRKHRVAGRGGGDRADRRVGQPALAAEKGGRAFGSAVRAVESYHMVKVGNNVKLLSFGRVADRPYLVEDYTNIADNYRNPLFKTGLMRALIRETPWHSRMAELFSEYPWTFFIEGEDTPKYLPRFGRDAREMLKAFRRDSNDEALDSMKDEEKLKHLSLIIQRLVNRYVEGRAEAKTGLKAKDFPKVPTTDGNSRRVYPKEFREAQGRVCSDAFLAMRSRHDQDFVNYFADSVCSVAQFLPPKDLHFLTAVLMTNPNPSPVGEKRLCWEDVKVVAMIAVSACAFNVRPRDTQAERGHS
ncbi:MAG: type I-MYXAN CRISPR-associated protein Cmx8 [Isosphaeraceae bacterium]